MSIPGRKDDKKGSADAVKPSPALLQAKKKWLSHSKMALKIAAIKTKSGQLRWIGFAFYLDKKNKKGSLFAADHKKRGKVLMADMKTALTKGVVKKVDEKDFCFGLASVSKVGGKNVLWTKYVKRLAGADKKIQDALIEMKLRYLVKMRKKKDDEADAAALEADEDRLEDEMEEEFEDELETTVEEYDDVEIGQDDDLEELERAAQEEGEAEDETASDDEESDEEESEDEESEDAESEDEESEGEDEEEDGEASGDDRKIAALRLGPKVWHGTRKAMTSGLDKLKEAVRAEYKDEAADLVAEIEKNMSKLDKILEKLDHRLAEAMEKAHKAPDEKARKAELDNARGILKEHIAFISSDPLIAHIDANPFGVKTNLKVNFVTAAKHLGKTIG